MILETALRHYKQDMRRARRLSRHASNLGRTKLGGDIARSALMFAVGALDAYFCDAFGDLIARSLHAKQIQPGVHIPDRLQDLKLPAVVFLRGTSSEGWRWRMAARELIEKNSVLSVEEIKDLFNQFFPPNDKLFSRQRLESWMEHRKAKRRVFGVAASRFRTLAGTLRNQALEKARTKLDQRFGEIFQRRHDCIHNCDRPKVAMQPITPDQANKILEDVDFLVMRCHEAFSEAFPNYLIALGFSAVTRNRVGAST